MITANVISPINCPINDVTINFGNSWYNLNNSLTMNINSEGQYEVLIPEQPYNTMFCFSINATICDEAEGTFYGSPVILPRFRLKAY